MSLYRTIFVTLFLLVPFSVLAAEEKSELVVILDTSGSMNSKLSNSERVLKIDYAKKELNKILKDFSDKDKFDLKLIHFEDSPVVTDFKKLNKGKYNNEVIPFIQKLTTNGYTPLAKSIDLSTDIFLSSGNKNKALLILSDGQDNDGIDAVVNSMKNLNTKTNGSVMVQFFAIGVDKQTWAEFNQISRVIKFGTLFLVESTGQGGDYFELSADAISGSWSSKQIRTQVGKRLGKAHAEHVHVVTSLDGSSTRDSSKRLKTIDWKKLKKDDPELYGKLKKWFEDLENDYNKLKMKEIISYLLNEIIRPKLSLDKINITNFETFKGAMSKIWSDFKYEMKKDSRMNEYEINGLKKALKDNELNNSSDYLSYSGNSTAIPLSYSGESSGESSTKGSSVSSFSSASIDLLFAYLVDELTDGLGSHEGMEGAGSFSSLLIPNLLYFVVFDQLDNERKSLLSLGRKEKLSSLIGSASLGASSASGNAMLTFDSFGDGSYPAEELLDRDKRNLRYRAVERQQQEYTAYQKYVERDEAVKALSIIFPELKKSEIVSRIKKASKTEGVIERALILFEGKKEYLEKIALVQILADDLEKKSKLTASLGDLAKQQSVVASGLRGNNELPDYVQAYFNNLKNDINDSNFSKRVDLFLLGIDQ